MKQRKLITGETVEDSPTLQTQKIITYSPDKWLRVDLEHGQVYDSKDNYIGKAVCADDKTIILYL